MSEGNTPKKKGLGTWIIVDALLLLAIIVVIVFIVQQGKENGETPAGSDITPTAEATAEPQPSEAEEPDNTPTPTTSVVGWNERESGRQYIDADGNLLMSTWKSIDGNRYCFDENGYVRVGWYTTEDGTYYFSASGVMQTGTTMIDGEDQTFSEEGLWLGKAEEVIATQAPTATPTATPSPTATPTPTATPVPTLVPDEYSVYSDTYNEWWFERKTDHSQSGGYGYDTKYKFDDVGAYYVNKDVTDDDKVFYLTFDAGYEYGFTDDILDTLAAHNAKAIFFVTKSFIRDEPELVIRMKEEGHLVGNHTCTHPNLGKSSVETIIKELTECAQYMKEKTGYEMDMFMRPPEGGYSERALHVIKDLGYKVIFWSIAYLDWDTSNQPGEDYVINHFTSYHHNGAIPLIHVQSESNTLALDEVLTLLEDNGYRFGSLTELK